MQRGFPAMRRAFASAVATAVLALALPAAAQDGAALLGRAADAARTLNYTGTIAYQRAAGVETARLIHVNDGGEEFEKLYNLDGPAREVIRSNGEVRCYYPDAKVVRVEPRTFRNAFPSLSPQQQSSLAQYYTVRKGGVGRVAGDGNHGQTRLVIVHRAQYVHQRDPAITHRDRVIPAPAIPVDNHRHHGIAKPA